MSEISVDRAVAVLAALAEYGRRLDGSEPLLSELPETLDALIDDATALRETIVP